MLHKRIMLGLTGLLMLAACGQPAPDEDVSDQGGKAPVVSAFSANQLGTGYFELAWSVSDKEGEDLRCTIQIDDGQTPGLNWLDLDEADDLVWVSSVAPEEADYNGFTFPVGGPNNVEGFTFPSSGLEGFTIPVGIYTGENTITPCTNLDKAYLAVRKPGSYSLRLMVTDSVAPVKTTYSRNVSIKANNLKPYIAGFGALVDGEDPSIWGDTFFPDPYLPKSRKSENPKASTITASDFPLTVTFYWDISDAFEEQWKDGGWFSYAVAPSPFPGSSNFLKCSLDLDGNNIYEVTLPGDCRSYQGNLSSLPVVGGDSREGYTHTFAKPGSYNVKLKVEDRLGGSHIATVRVGLENNEPPYTGIFLNTSFFQNYALPDGLRQASTARLPGGYDPVLKGYPEEFVWFTVDKEDSGNLKCFLDPEGDGTFQISLPSCTGTPPNFPTGQVKGQDTLPLGCVDASEVTEGTYTGTFCLGYYEYAYPKRGQYFPRLKVVDSKGLATETQLGFNPFWGLESNGDGPPLAYFAYLLLGYLSGGSLGGDYLDDVFDVCSPIIGSPVLRNGLPRPNAGSELAPFTRCDTLPAMHFLPVANMGVYRGSGETQAGFYRSLYQFGLPGSLTCTFDKNIFDSIPPVTVDCADNEWNPLVEYTTPGRYTSRFTVNDGAGTWSDTESICLAGARDIEVVDQDGAIRAAAWSPNGKWIASYDTLIPLHLYNAANRNNLIQTDNEPIGTPEFKASIDWSPDSKYLAISDYDNVLVLRVLSNGTVTQVGSTNGDNDHGDNHDNSGTAEDDDLTAVAWSPNGKYIADASEDGDIKIWSTTDLANIHNRLVETIDNNTPTDTNQEIWSLAWSPNSRYLVSGSGNTREGYPPTVTDIDSTVKIWDLLDPTNPVLVATYDQPILITKAVAWSPDGRVIAAGDEEGQIYFWDVSDIQRNNIRYKGQVNIKLSGNPSFGPVVSALAFSPDSRTLASGVRAGGSGRVYVWDVANLNDIRWVSTLKDYSNSGYLGSDLLSVGFSPDGKTILTGDDETNLVLWNANDLTVCTGK